MSKREKLIEEFLKLPIQVGERVQVRGLSSNNPDRQEGVDVVKMDKTKIYFKKYGYTELQSRLISEVEKDTDHIGHIAEGFIGLINALVIIVCLLLGSIIFGVVYYIKSKTYVSDKPLVPQIVIKYKSVDGVAKSDTTYIYHLK